MEHKVEHKSPTMGSLVEMGNQNFKIKIRLGQSYFIWPSCVAHHLVVFSNSLGCKLSAL